MLNTLRSGFIVPLLLLMIGCAKETDSQPLMTPDMVAKNFMLTLFTDKNEQVLAGLSTPKLAKSISDYTPSQYARVILNMVLSPPIDVQSHSLRLTEGAVRGEVDRAKLIVVVSGTRQARQIADIRLVSLIKTDGKWQVEAVTEPKFNTESRYGVEDSSL